MFSTAEVYKSRRNEILNNMPENSAMIIPSWPETKRSGDVDWPYRPSSDLYYFTGFEEANSCFLLLSKPQAQHILFTKPKNSEKELWTGPIHGPEQATDIFQMDTCYLSSEFANIAPEILKNTNSIYYTFGINPIWDAHVNKLIQILKNKKKVSVSVHDTIRIIAPLRMIKSQEEINIIKKAVDISAQAHIEVMKYTQAGLSERQVHGRFLYEIMKRGAHSEAYPGIFASGPNACILHYIDNKCTLQNGDLLLVDAGAEYQYYSSDITRTFPINGKFSEIQKRLYKKVLEIQKSLIKTLKPGVSFKNIHEKMAESLSILMKEENLLEGSIKDIIDKKKYKKYCAHSFGHLLGLDVHDLTFSKTEDIVFKEGFVLTIEPGLYLPSEDFSLKPELRGLGFRIEDDILITKTGAEVLSHAVPKEVEEIENICLSGH